MRIYVLRIGHRPERDKRITTHVGLVARAFGADGFVLEGCDENVMKSLIDVERRWGRMLEEITCVDSGIKYAREWKRRGGEIIHLTMYGIHVDDIIDEIRISNKDKLIVVGAEKVPREYYEIADYNVAIGNQPHSEVAALAVFLDRLFEGKEFAKKPINPKLIIVPSERGKKVIGRE